MADQIRREFFRRMDESEDEIFYSAPRLVVHIDEGAIAEIGRIFESVLPPRGTFLDLMSSWRSHIPPSLVAATVVGLGLNQVEMQENPVLKRSLVHNLNRDPHLPFEDGEFDGAMLTVSVQYLVRPIEVFAEVGRVLKPGAPFMVSFSNRMFPTKAVALWIEATEQQRVELVKHYFRSAEMFDKITALDRSERPGAPSDPVWAVIGRRRERNG